MVEHYRPLIVMKHIMNCGRGLLTVADAGIQPDTFGVTGQGERRVMQRLGSLAPAIIGVWRRHRDLLGNASALVATTGVTSGLGFVYWAFAARLFTQRSVGYGSAAISAMTLLGTIGMFGLGTVLIGELPRRSHRAGLIAAALIASSVGSLLLGVAFAVVAPHISAHLSQIGNTPERAALFAAGVVATAVTLVFDQATIGMLRGGIQLTRNVTFAVAKLLLLPIFAFILHDAFGIGIAFSWVAGVALSLIPVVIQLRLSGAPIVPKPDWRLLQSLGKTAVAHNWLNLAISVPVLLMPVLATVVVSPSANAAFYVAWMLAGFLYLIPINLSTVLFAIAAADPAVIARKLRFSLSISLVIGIAGMAILGLGAHLALRIFGAGYVRTATLPLRLLIIGYIPMVPRTHYVAVCRANGRISWAAVVLTTGAAMEIVAAVIGGKYAGLIGFSFALLLARLVEGLMTAPAVVRATLVRGRHRKTELGTKACEDSELVHAAHPEASREQQDAGIAMLISIATLTGSS
jgi:O-antigen/teichoic acid export membrane protein